jgi:hypothetical protein
MSARPLLRAAQVALLACFAPSTAFAHSFSTPYILPIPFWIYLYGCAGTLVVTFAVLGFFASEPVAAGGAQAASRLVADRSSPRLSPWFVSLLRVGAVLSLLLTVVAGFIGNTIRGGTSE